MSRSVKAVLEEVVSELGLEGRGGLEQFGEVGRWSVPMIIHRASRVMEMGEGKTTMRTEKSSV